MEPRVSVGRPFSGALRTVRAHGLAAVLKRRSGRYRSGRLRCWRPASRLSGLCGDLVYHQLDVPYASSPLVLAVAADVSRKHLRTCSIL